LGKKIPNYLNPNHITSGIIEFADEKCTRCGICATACGGGSIVIPPKSEGEKRGLPYVEELVPGISGCVGCGDCYAACPNGAITVKRGFTVNKPYYYHRIVQTSKLTFPKKY